MAPESKDNNQPDLSPNSLATTLSPAPGSGPVSCARCGHDNPETVERCLICTASLVLTCPKCQQPVVRGGKFCGHCGIPLKGTRSSVEPGARVQGAVVDLPLRTPEALGEKIASASIKAAGERREVTVLFLEVINFTAASRSLDSEDAYELINEAMSSLVEVVRKYGGTIDKFTGNGLMALFGAPVAHENDPERAVRAAL